MTVNLVPPVSVVAEPLEGNHQNLGQHPQVKLLGGLTMLLAPRAVPGVVHSKLLLKTLIFNQSDHQCQTTAFNQSFTKAFFSKQLFSINSFISNICFQSITHPNLLLKGIIFNQSIHHSPKTSYSENNCLQ